MKYRRLCLKVIMYESSRFELHFFSHTNVLFINGMCDFIQKALFFSHNVLNLSGLNFILFRILVSHCPIDHLIIFILFFHHVIVI